MKKKILFATLVFFAMLLIATNVKAVEVSNWVELKGALQGTEEEVKLTSAITEDTEASETKISISGKKVLDLNGLTLTLKNAYFEVAGNAELTIDGKGCILSDVRKTVDCITGGTLNIKSGTIKNTHNDSRGNSYHGRVIGTWGTETDTGVVTTINVEKGVILISDYGYGINVFEDVTKGSYNVRINTAATIRAKQMAITISGNVKEITGNVPTINIKEGADFESPEVAIYGAGYGKWTIEQGTKFVGAEALTIKSGTFDIKGGDFIANGEYVENPIAKGNGAESTGNAINIISHSSYAGNIEVKLSETVNVESKNGYAVYENILEGTDLAVDNLEIINGTFTGKVGAVKSENLEGFVEAGNFSDELDESYVSENSESVEIDGRKYYGLPYEITIDEDSKKVISVSKTTAIPGEVVEVIINEEEIKDKYEFKGLVISFNRDQIEVNGTSFEMPEADVEIKAVLKEIEKDPDPTPTPDPEPDKNPEPDKEPEKDETPKTGAMTGNIVVMIIVLAVTIFTVKFANKKRV